MRIKHIKIKKWRHFENVEIFPPEGCSVLCLVGANGTGKSQILELIAACAHSIGLSPGTDNPRGSPFSEAAEFEVKFIITWGAVAALNDEGALADAVDAALNSQSPGNNYNSRKLIGWDRTLTVTYSNGRQILAAGGVQSQLTEITGQVLKSLIMQSASIHYLFLDADRAYPKIDIAPSEIGSLLNANWQNKNKAGSFQKSANLYGEWFRYLVGREGQQKTNFVRDIRIARAAQVADPTFVDQLEPYKAAINEVLPHLLFVGLDEGTNEVKFDANGVSLTFTQLSGGEREIAFLVGQVDRFALKKGIFLVDEPELHLNNELVRKWISFLRDSVQEGQIWLASHSVEVVEVVGAEATFLLERDEDTRLVKANALSEQPLIGALSRSVGSPAFSISKLTFVFIEGDESIGERERFRRLSDASLEVRFLEGGSCKEVIRRLETVKMLSTAAGQVIDVKGVVDRDRRPESDRSELLQKGIFVLPVHEVENFFIHPDTLNELAHNLGCPDRDFQNVILEKADKRAGAWIFDAARTDSAFISYPSPSEKVRTKVHGTTWKDFEDRDKCCKDIVSSDEALNDVQRTLLYSHLVAHAGRYSKHRLDGTLWKICEGKELLKTISRELNFTNSDTLERAVVALWKQRVELIPEELSELRLFVNGSTN